MEEDMEVSELDRRFAELKERCLKLSAEDRQRALDGFTQVLTLCELPREPGESVSLSISLSRESGLTHLSG
jgi:hypothetical protein